MAVLGVFDSGLGGLTVVREIARCLPQEQVLYFGDTARCPYGARSPEEVRDIALQLVEFLSRRGAELVIMACNTSTAMALQTARGRCPIPILGVIAPGVEAALEKTRNGRLAVIATEATVRSGGYRRAVQKLSPQASVMEQACPRFVPLVENGITSGPEAERVAAAYLQAINDSESDTLILGCTHYPLLEGVIGHHLRPGIKLVDPSQRVVQMVRDMLSRGQVADDRMPSYDGYQFFTSGDPASFRSFAKTVCGVDARDVMAVSLAELEDLRA